MPAFTSDWSLLCLFMFVILLNAYSSQPKLSFLVLKIEEDLALLFRFNALCVSVGEICYQCLCLLDLTCLTFIHCTKIVFLLSLLEGFPSTFCRSDMVSLGKRLQESLLVSKSERVEVGREPVSVSKTAEVPSPARQDCV